MNLITLGERVSLTVFLRRGLSLTTPSAGLISKMMMMPHFNKGGVLMDWAIFYGGIKISTLLLPCKYIAIIAASIVCLRSEIRTEVESNINVDWIESSHLCRTQPTVMTPCKYINASICKFSRTCHQVEGFHFWKWILQEISRRSSKFV